MSPGAAARGAGLPSDTAQASEARAGTSRIRRCVVPVSANAGQRVTSRGAARSSTTPSRASTKYSASAAGRAFARRALCSCSPQSVWTRGHHANTSSGTYRVPDGGALLPRRTYRTHQPPNASPTPPRRILPSRRRLADTARGVPSEGPSRTGGVGRLDMRRFPAMHDIGNVYRPHGRSAVL